MALGSSVIIRSNLGSSAFDALNMGLSDTFGYTPGKWCIICGSVIIIINAILLRKPPNIFSFLTSIIVGVFIDIWLQLIPTPNDLYLVRMSMFFVGIIFNAFGIAYYTKTDVANGPIDQLMILIHEIFHQSYFSSKIIMEVFLIFLAYLFHGTVGIGTFIIMFVSGYFINLFYKLLDK